MIVANVDVGRLAAVIRRFPPGIVQSMDAIIDQNALLLMSSSGNVPGLVQVTPPFHGGVRGTAAKRAGEGAVESDIRSVYAQPGRIYELIKSYDGERAANGWWWLLKNDPTKARRYLELEAPSRLRGLQIGFDGGAVHRANRNRRTGRVRGGPYGLILDQRNTGLNRYIRERKKRVGLLASGWVSDAGKLGQVRGVPAWVARHSANLGEVRRIRRGGAYLVRIENTARYAESDSKRRAQSVLRYRVSALNRQLPYLARKYERQLAGMLAAA